ncbi:MAG TPA: HAMP domain-containing sensor histidine kinase [Planctomycetaceae bacterium]|nr:HAMP domain-containing sensor histidine kinase [Planctomycetaceae bacterium]
MSVQPAKRDSLIRFTSRLADELQGLKPGAHRLLAEKILKGIGRRCDLDHVHLYLSQRKTGKVLPISLFSDWSRSGMPSIASQLQRVALTLFGEQAAVLLPAGTAVYCGVNERSDSCSRLVSGILRDLQCSAYEMIPIRIGEKLRAVIAVGHDHGAEHLDAVCHQLLQLAGRVFVGSYSAARRESRRKRNHRQWRNVANGACDFAMVLNSALEIVDVVPFGESNLPAISGLRLQDIVPRNSYEPLRQTIEDAIESDQARTCDLMILQRQGKTCSFSTRIEPGGTSSASVCTLYLTNNDVERAAVDELNLLREQLDRASRLSVLGNISSEYAHQLTQPLQVISAQAFTLKRRLRNPDADMAKTIEGVIRIEASVDLARDVIISLRDFLQNRQARPCATDLRRMIEHASRMVQPFPDSGVVRISIDDPEGLLDQIRPFEVHVDRVQTTYVLINLLVNAIEACTNAQTLEPEIRIQLRRHSTPKFVLISVCDNGPGLPAGDSEQVFQRFFTTKSSGFGIGLAICRDVIERQRGKILAQNNAGPGSTFTFSVLVQSDEIEEETRRLEEDAEDLLDSNTHDGTRTAKRRAPGQVRLRSSEKYTSRGPD